MPSPIEYVAIAGVSVALTAGSTQMREAKGRDLIRAALLVLTVLAPLPLGANRPWAWTLLAFAFGLLLLVHVFAGWRSEAPTDRGLALPGLLFAAVCAYVYVQTLPAMLVTEGNLYWGLVRDHLGLQPHGSISVDPDRSLTGLMRLVLYGSAFWMARRLFVEATHAETAIFVVALASGLNAAYAIVNEVAGVNMVLWFAKWASYEAATGSFVNRNHFATYTGIGLICALAFLCRKALGGASRRAGLDDTAARLILRPRADVMLMLAIVLVNQLALFLSQSRAGLVAELVAVLVFLVGVTLKTQQRRALLVPLLLFAGAAIVVYAITSAQDTLDRIADYVTGGDTGMRMEVYAATMEAIADFPLLGVGYGGFEDVFRIYRQPPINLDFDFAHNSYLELALELGIPAAVALVLAISWPAVACCRSLRRKRSAFVYGWAAFCISVLVGLHALLDFSLQIPAVALTYAVVLGVGYAQSKSTSRNITVSDHG